MLIPILWLKRICGLTLPTGELAERLTLAGLEVENVHQQGMPEAGDGLRPDEELRLSLLMTGTRGQLSVHQDPKAAENFDFFDLKGVIETVLSRLGVAFDDVEYVSASGNPTFTHNWAVIQIKGERQGIMGQLAPKELTEFGLSDRDVYVAELRGRATC